MMQRELDQLNEEYKREAQELDDRFQSEAYISRYSHPSAQLLELRRRCQLMIKLKKPDETTKLQKQIAIKEEKERQFNETQMAKDYKKEDDQLKQLYAQKREVIIVKYERKIKSLSQMNENDIPLNERLKLKNPTKIDRENDLALLHLMTEEYANGVDFKLINIDTLYKKIIKQNKNANKRK